MATVTATKKAHRARIAIPKMAPSAEAPAKLTPAPASKPSIWTRVKTMAKKTVTVVSKIYARVKARITRAIDVAKPVVSKLWRLALKPLLLGTLSGVALFGLVVGAIVAPLTTVFMLLVAGLATLSLAHGVKSLEAHESVSRLARVTLRVLETIARIVVGLVYTAAALLVVGMCLASWAFTAFAAAFVVLAYLEVRGSASIAFLAWSLLTGNWALAIVWALLFAIRIPTRAVAETVPAYSEIRLKTDVHEDVIVRPAPSIESSRVRLAQERTRKGMPVRPSDAPNNPELWTRGNHLVAKGTEELWGTEHDIALVVHDDADEGRAVSVEAWDAAWDNDQVCGACKASKGALRIRSMNVPFATGGTQQGEVHERERDLLCATCFEAECEDVALALTGVSLTARSTEVRLSQKGIAHSPEHAASVFDPTMPQWLESMWWRDRNGEQYPREWTCLVNGREAALVVKDHKRQVFRASVLGRVVPNGTKKTIEEAKRVAENELSDEANAVERHVEAADAVVADGARRQSKKS